MSQPQVWSSEALEAVIVIEPLSVLSAVKTFPYFSYPRLLQY